MRLASILVLSVAAMALCSCSSVMKPVSHKTSVGADKALVSFYYRASPLNTGPIEVFADDVSYGKIDRRTGLQVELEPGKHTFYALLGRNWGIMEASVSAGKKYFAYLVPIPDFFTGAKVSIAPISAAAGPAAKATDFAKTTTLALDPLKKDGFQAKRKGALKRIKARHEAGKTKPSTLAAGDGI